MLFTSAIRFWYKLEVHVMVHHSNLLCFFIKSSFHRNKYCELSPCFWIDALWLVRGQSCTDVTFTFCHWCYFYFLPIMPVPRIADTNYEADHFEIYLANLFVLKQKPTTEMQASTLLLALAIIKKWLVGGYTWCIYRILQRKRSYCRFFSTSRNALWSKSRWLTEVDNFKI